ncbi:MAG: DNA polymerase III subunit gamma/tau, partial [Actinobacteria bacterium]|nr:DNA polymerase III subunit gamma/tau [Actinomycetota bacterium]
MVVSLYRKYRPQTFGDVVGQEHVERTLRNAVSEGTTSHAYLFSGPRGTGKTTTARLLAKALLCDNAPTPNPCGVCESCNDIAASVHPDVYELDAASRTGVDNVREEIIGRVSFAPTRGHYKVYIIDEVHMLSIAAFNALLKTLEEPPEHVVFILCTTDPHKVPDTIRSRCQNFEFHRIGIGEIVGNLRLICEKEGFIYEDSALELIAKHSSGGMRDAISTLEQLSVFTSGSLTFAAAEGLLGEVEESQLFDIVRLVAARDVVGCFRWVAKFVEGGTDLAQLSRDLTACFRNIYVASLTGGKEGMEDSNPDEIAQCVKLAKAFGGPDRLSRTLLLLADLNMERRGATDPRLSLEIAFTRMARPDSDLTLESLAERVEALESGVGVFTTAGVSPGVGFDPAPAPRFEPKPLADETAPERVAENKPSVPMNTATEQAPPVKSGGELSAAESPDSAEPAAAPAAAPAVLTKSSVQRLWANALVAIKKESPSLAAMFASARAHLSDDEKLVIEFPPGSTFSLRVAD